jgi:mannose-1-phosphate guanylyltransferase
MCLYLNYMKETSQDGNENTKNKVLIHESAKIGKDCQIGPNVIIGENVVIGDGCRLERCTIFEKSTIGSYSYVKDSIIGWGAILGKWTRIENNSVLGSDVFIKPTIYINGGIILPNKEMGEDVLIPGTIKM